jgi:hypothetical protein
LASRGGSILKSDQVLQALVIQTRRPRRRVHPLQPRHLDRRGPQLLGDPRPLPSAAGTPTIHPPAQVLQRPRRHDTCSIHAVFLLTSNTPPIRRPLHALLPWATSPIDRPFRIPVARTLPTIAEPAWFAPPVDVRQDDGAQTIVFQVTGHSTSELCPSSASKPAVETVSSGGPASNGGTNARLRTSVPHELYTSRSGDLLRVRITKRGHACLRNYCTRRVTSLRSEP